MPENFVRPATGQSAYYTADANKVIVGMFEVGTVMTRECVDEQVGRRYCHVGNAAATSTLKRRVPNRCRNRELG